MKRSLLLFILLGMSNLLRAQNIDLAWQNQLAVVDTANGNYSLISPAAGVTDDNGNLILTGHFNELVDFDADTGVTNFYSDSITSCFIAKYDEQGALLFAKSWGGTSESFVISTVRDAAGNMYVSGLYYGPTDFDPGPAVNSGTYAGSGDVYLSKFDPQGNLIWTNQFGGTGNDECFGLALEPSGNILLSGTFIGTVDFDPGAGVHNLTSSGSSSGYLISITPAGTLDWAKHYDGLVDIHRVAIDSTDNIVLAGSYYGTFDFDTGAGVDTLSANMYYPSLFVSRLDSSGNYLSTVQMLGMPSPPLTHALIADVEIDHSGSIYLTGGFRGAFDFDPNQGNLQTSAGVYDGFVVKLDPSMQLDWSYFFGSTQFDNTRSMVLSQDQSQLYITGSFDGTTSFNPASGSGTMTSSGSYDAFYLNLDTAGNFGWVSGFGGSGTQVSHTLIPHPNHGFYAAGYFESFSWFQNAILGTSMTANQFADGFIFRFIGCEETSDTVQVTACGSYVAPWGATYTATGTYIDTLLSPAGCDSIVTLELTVINNSMHIDTVAACSSYSVLGSTYTATGMYFDTTSASSGCDSIIVTNLTIQSSMELDTLQVCAGHNQPMPDGTTLQNLQADTLHQSVLTNSSGCDSIIQWLILVHESFTDTNSVHLCSGSNYTFPDGMQAQNVLNYESQTSILLTVEGCDSIIFTELFPISDTVHLMTDTICAGQSYTWPDGTTVANPSGFVSDTSLWGASTGCDSVVIASVFAGAQQNGVSQTGDTLFAVMQADNYQWLLCPSLLEVEGATSSSFAFPFEGFFALASTNAGCIDTTGCFAAVFSNVVTTALNKQSISIYPNPASSELYIKFSEPMNSGVEAQIFSVQGKRVHATTLNNGATHHLNLPELAPGLYFLQLAHAGAMHRFRFVVE